jgi:hypothetical protein
MGARFGRAWKLVVVVAAGLATFSFFTPFVEISHEHLTVPVSAYRIVAGFDEVGQIDPALRKLPPRARHEQLETWNYAIQHEPYVVLGQRPRASHVPYYYLSAALLLVVSAIAIARRQLSLLAALYAVAGGLGATGSWLHELSIGRLMSSPVELAAHITWGATLLAIAGAIALVAGIGALLWVDPGGFRAARKITALVEHGEGPVAIDMPTSEQDATIPTATLRAPSARAGAKHGS